MVLRHFIIVHEEIRIGTIVKFHAMFSQPVVWTHFAIGYRSGHISLKVPNDDFFYVRFLMFEFTSVPLCQKPNIKIYKPGCFGLG